MNAWQYLGVVIICTLLILTFWKSRRNRRKYLDINNSYMALVARVSKQEYLFSELRRERDTLERQVKALAQERIVLIQLAQVAKSESMQETDLFHFDTPPSEQEVKARYKKLSRAFHPDVQGSHELMTLLNRQYQTLK
ncbi:J domain-containing protein [Vibrio fluvialis]|uniref:J domain-containing protein n=1 Tax=Vibrio fluvialis TaxID=676 RepID=UPI001EEB9DBD|nr:J domain-containing protein [Vibrio fluvialis]MCG6405316.1 J domain-containing protein [Vibrio fluvialis]